jgi:hypothetical protein
MRAAFTIDARFRGPPESGNGGYVCGLLAARLAGGCAAVTLRHPPPLDRSLTLETDGRDRAVLSDGDRIIAEAAASTLALVPPAAPDLAAAELASRGYRGFDRHLYPGCFVCGPQRAEGDGLRIFAGPVAGTSLVAAPWVPDASLANDAGEIASAFLWAVLDCPGYFALTIDRERPMLLGRLTAEIFGTLRAGETAIVAGWELGREGRKHYAGTALYAASGAVLGKAQAVWIALQAPADEARQP